MEERLCVECGKRLSGRIDKKFCSDACRIANFNKHGTSSKNVVKATNRILLKNYKILLRFNVYGKTKISKSELDLVKFDFGYLTEILETPKGKRYYYCYGQGYVLLEDDVYLLVVKTQTRKL